jgi:hypothetical protein
MASVIPANMLSSFPESEDVMEEIDNFWAASDEIMASLMNHSTDFASWTLTDNVPKNSVFKDQSPNSARIHVLSAFRRQTSLSAVWKFKQFGNHMVFCPVLPDIRASPYATMWDSEHSQRKLDPDYVFKGQDRYAELLKSYIKLRDVKVLLDYRLRESHRLDAEGVVQLLKTSKPYLVITFGEGAGVVQKVSDGDDPAGTYKASTLCNPLPGVKRLIEGCGPGYDEVATAPSRDQIDQMLTFLDSN